MDKHGFIELHTSHDHTLALGSTVLLNFNMPQLNEGQNMSLHALHVYDPTRFPTCTAIKEMLGKI